MSNQHIKNTSNQLKDCFVPRNDNQNVIANEERMKQSANKQKDCFVPSNDVRVPKLRFKEFEEDWFKKLYGDIYSFYSTNSYSRDKLNYDKKGVRNIHYGDIHTKFSSLFNIKNELVPFINEEVDLTRIKEGNYCQVGDLVIADASEDYNDIGKSIEIVNLNGEKTLAGLHTFLARPNKYKMQLGFSNYLVQSWKVRKQIMTIAQGTKILGIATSRLSKIELNLPNLQEQQKIATFLTAVDDKIQQLTKKKTLLEQYKKGAMQQIFSQQLRFKPDETKQNVITKKTIIANSNNIAKKSVIANDSEAISNSKKEQNSSDAKTTFPDWEEKKLGEVSTKVSYGMNSAAISFDGKHKYLRITDIDEDSRKFIPKPLSSPDGLIEDKFKMKINDIVFARTGASTGKSYLYNPSDGDLYYAGFLIKFSISKANAYFIYLQTFRENYKKWVQIFSMRSGQPGLNAEEYKNFKINLPCFEEQQKIATYLSAINTKIDNVQTQLTKTQTFKKGLLQQMFV